MLFCYLLTFFKILTISKTSFRNTTRVPNPLELLVQFDLQTVWMQIRTDSMSVLIWVQTVCNGYQQMTKIDAIKERVKHLNRLSIEELIKYALAKIKREMSTTLCSCSYPSVVSYVWLLKRTISMRWFF